MVLTGNEGTPTESELKIAHESEKQQYLATEFVLWSDRKIEENNT